MEFGKRQRLKNGWDFYVYALHQQRLVELAGLAQSVERWTAEREVAGSIFFGDNKWISKNDYSVMFSKFQL